METIPRYINGGITVNAQPDGGATYARKITREDGIIDWAQPALNVHNQIRALDPWPGARSMIESPSGDVVVKIWRAELAGQTDALPGGLLVRERNRLLVACGGGEGLEILELQSPGSRRVSTTAFLAGHDLSGGRFLGKAIENL